MDFFKERANTTDNPQETIGLDIGSRMIKWVCLDENHVLKHYAIHAIPFPITAAHREAKMASCLKETLLEREFIKNCILNIPDSLIFSYWVEIDYPSSQTIHEVIEWLVGKSILCPVNELYFDYQIFDLSHQNQCNVLIVACRKEHLDFRVNIVHEAHLIPTVVEVNSHALERACLFFYPKFNQENNVLLEISTSQMTFLFFNTDQPQPVVYCENLLNERDQENILLQIKRNIKRYVLSHPDYSVNQITLIGSDPSLVHYLLIQLDGFLKINVKNLEKECMAHSELNKNFLRLFLSYGLALRSYAKKKEKNEIG
ncbi:type IV pilus biogenesis protein PilM [Rickettsiella grylli]|uniref:Type IV pilus assembly protein PilM n=1 Tax=Rickettsiella grylli TaxID=59196 RepID=A8PP58_9COXI|nr:pilus assembly protein PilM [Rickettsiella grylli]EDP45994.1 hypothetical protein RICGR_1208 [Rickettsiella grylli]